MFRRELCEDLAVEHKTSLLQLRDERAVGLVAVVADGGVQADNPDLTERGLFVAAMGESIAAGAHKRFMRIALFLGTYAAIALGPLENILAAFLRHDSPFDSCHMKMITVGLITTGKEASANSHRQIYFDRTTLAAALGSARLRIEMVLTF